MKRFCAEHHDRNSSPVQHACRVVAKIYRLMNACSTTAKHLGQHANWTARQTSLLVFTLRAVELVHQLRLVNPVLHDGAILANQAALLAAWDDEDSSLPRLLLDTNSSKSKHGCGSAKADKRFTRSPFRTTLKERCWPPNSPAPRWSGTSQGTSKPRQSARCCKKRSLRSLMFGVPELEGSDAVARRR